MTTTGEQSLGQRLLYFPFMTIPSRLWIRQALMYWDGMAIFTNEQWASAMGGVEGDLDCLRREGLVTLISPESLFVSAITAAEADRNAEADNLLALPAAKAIQKGAAGQLFCDWFSTNILLLQAQAEAERDGTTLDKALRAHLGARDLELTRRVQRRLADQLGVSEEEARVHFVMHTVIRWGLLARDFGAISADEYVPSTDVLALGRLLYSPIAGTSGPSAAGLVLSNAFPMPDEEVPIEDVLRFKEKYWRQYQRLRLSVDQLAAELSDVSDLVAARRRIREFVRMLDIQRHELATKLRRRRLDAVLNTCEAVLQTQSSQFLEATGGMVFVSEIPVWWKAIGLGTPLVLNVVKHAIRERNALRDLAEASPVAYLYGAKKRGMLYEVFPARRLFRRRKARRLRHE
jgi:hypothetical protein